VPSVPGLSVPGLSTIYPDLSSPTVFLTGQQFDFNFACFSVLLYLLNHVCRWIPKDLATFRLRMRAQRDSIKPEDTCPFGQTGQLVLKLIHAPQSCFLVEHLLDGLLAVGVEQNAETPFAFRLLPAVKVIAHWDYSLLLSPQRENRK